MAAHGVEQHQRGGDVVVIVLGRVDHGFAHLNEGGEVHDAIELMFTKDLIEQRGVTDIALYELTTQHRIPMPVGEIIQGHHPMPLLQQHLHHVRANVARTAYHQNLELCHALFPFLMPSAYQKG